MHCFSSAPAEKLYYYKGSLFVLWCEVQLFFGVIFARNFNFKTQVNIGSQNKNKRLAVGAVVVTVSFGYVAVWFL